MPSNNTTSNTVEDLARIFLEGFESSRCLVNTVDTQLIQGRFTPRSGQTVSVKRPHDYNAIETQKGDISGSNKSDIIAGKATATVQNYITVATEWENIEEAMELDQLDQIIRPMSTRAVTKLETNLATYCMKNCGSAYGTPGQVVDAWSDVAGAGAYMDSRGIAFDNDVFYLMNPFTTMKLADAQRGLSSGSDSLVNTAWQRAQISDKFGNLKALSCNTLATVTDPNSLTDRAGTVTGTPVVTYTAHKDTMIQDIGVTAMSTTGVVKAGMVVEVTGRFQLNLSTREAFVDETGAKVKWRGVVTEDVTLSSGAGTLKVAGPAIYESDGQYNSTDAAVANGDVITVLGSAGDTYQPNLCFHKQAFGMATVKLPKLFSTDTVATTEDGFSIRVSKYADGDTNVQKVRFDILPAFVTFDSYKAIHGYGLA